MTTSVSYTVGPYTAPCDVCGRDAEWLDVLPVHGPPRHDVTCWFCDGWSARAQAARRRRLGLPLWSPPEQLPDRLPAVREQIRRNPLWRLMHQESAPPTQC